MFNDSLTTIDATLKKASFIEFKFLIFNLNIISHLLVTSFSFTSFKCFLSILKSVCTGTFCDVTMTSYVVIETYSMTSQGIA